MTKAPTPTLLRMPVFSAPVVRESGRPPGPLGTKGLEISAVDCSKLRGIARDMCYRAQARARL